MASVRIAIAAACSVLLAASVSACGGSPAPTISVSPTSALYDMPLTIGVTGLAKDATATLKLTTDDAHDVPWTSSAVFRADGSGRISTQNAPVSGSYSGADPMGLVETLSSGDLDATFAFPDHWTMTVSVLVDGRTRAHTSVTRLLAGASGIHTIEERPAAAGIYGTLYLPAKTPARPEPAVVAIGGSEGGESGSTLAALLAAHGYPALALAYFHEPGLPAALEKIPLEYFAAGLRLLAGQPGVDPQKLVMWGVSRGSEAALLTAVHYPDLVHGVVGSVPGSEAFGGIPDDTQPAWTFGGVGVPTASNADFRDPDPTAAAAIPVERIDGPMLLACGTGDDVWNSCANVAAIRTRLASHGITRPPTVITSDGAGHRVGSFLPYLPSTTSSGTTASGEVLEGGGTFQADQAGRAKEWPALLAFLTAL